MLNVSYNNFLSSGNKHLNLSIWHKQNSLCLKGVGLWRHNEDISPVCRLYLSATCTKTCAYSKLNLLCVRFIYFAWLVLFIWEHVKSHVFYFTKEVWHFHSLRRKHLLIFEWSFQKSSRYNLNLMSKRFALRLHFSLRHLCHPFYWSLFAQEVVLIHRVAILINVHTLNLFIQR